MKQIYNFECIDPPIINENMLRTEQEKRKVTVQTTIAAIGSLLLLAVIALLGSITYELYPWITAICLIYIIISVTGSSVIVVTCTRKGGRKL